MMETLTCTICNTEIPAAQFAAHVQIHAIEFDSKRGIQRQRRTVILTEGEPKRERPKRDKFEKPKILRRLKL